MIIKSAVALILTKTLLQVRSDKRQQERGWEKRGKYENKMKKRGQE